MIWNSQLSYTDNLDDSLPKDAGAFTLWYHCHFDIRRRMCDKKYYQTIVRDVKHHSKGLKVTSFIHISSFAEVPFISLQNCQSSLMLVWYYDIINPTLLLSDKCHSWRTLFPGQCGSLRDYRSTEIPRIHQLISHHERLSLGTAQKEGGWMKPYLYLNRIFTKRRNSRYICQFSIEMQVLWLTKWPWIFCTHR